MDQNNYDARTLKAEFERLIADDTSSELDIEKVFDARIRARFGRFISETILAERQTARHDAKLNP
jgi:hypothetical protein